MVLTDCENPTTDIPGLTVSLRGLYDVELICEALESDVHSGVWGNAAPDPGNALVLLLARLLDEDGRMCVGRVDVDDEWCASVADIPLDDDVVRLGARLRKSVAPLPDRGRSTAEWIWRQPAITVLSTTLPRPTDQKNAIRARASATLSVRLAPGQTRADMRRLLEEVLLVDAPPYDVFVNLLRKSNLVLTDSGGIQEEVTVLNKFALVLRNQTERPEAVPAGYAKVTGTDEAGIVQTALNVLPQCMLGELPLGKPSPFGDGKASGRILSAVRWACGLEESAPPDYGAPAS